MVEFIIGSFCKSIAGHDKDTIYVITGQKNGIQLCDGRYKKLSNPKLKNMKHIEILEYRDKELDAKIEQNKLRDEDIKYSIKQYMVHNSQT